MGQADRTCLPTLSQTGSEMFFL